MAWTVEWSEVSEADDQQSAESANIYLALGGRDDALAAAFKYLEAGCIVWCIKNDLKVLEMDRHRVFHHFHPLTS